MRIGLISDTHMPRRWNVLPQPIFDLFSTCDVILHAGDVGELWVLDQLSQSAPVIAVHGNDETDEATNALPFLQTLAFNGHRIVLTHSHYPDYQTEMNMRKDDSWYHKLQYRADFGKAHGAKIVVTGHTHIPMCVEYDGIWLINPGAIASGSGWMKQVVQTVAVMTLNADETPHIEFYDIHTLTTYTPEIDWDAGFIVASQKTNVPIVSNDVLAERDWLMRILYPLNPMFLEDTLLPLCHEVWAKERNIITLDDIANNLLASDAIPDNVLTQLCQHEVFARYFQQ